MSLYIYSWNQASNGASLLADALDIPRIKHRNSRFVAGPNKTVINWGASTLPEQVLGCRVINIPEAINLASNKLNSFNRFEQRGVAIPRYTTSLNTAQEWLESGWDVVARTVLNGHSGNGIVLMEAADRATWHVQAPLYTSYVKKQHEYRIHVVAGVVTTIQKKGLSQEFQNRDDINWKVRNLANGFVYVRNDVQISPVARDLAVQAVDALGLDFGAVDIIYNRANEQYFVLEVNTAPGLSGTTIQEYASAFRLNYGN